MANTITVVPGYTLTWEFNFDPTTAGGVPGAPQYAFGVQTIDDSWWFHEGTAPTAWVRIGSGATPATGVIVEEEGGSLGSFTTLNFVGAGVTAANAGGGVASVTVPGGIALQEEGAPVTGNPHATVNFVGAGVTATDVAGVGTVTVPGGIALQDEGVAVTGNPHATVNFVGAGVTATDVAGVGTVTIPGSAASSFYFGTGDDGDITFDGTTTILGIVPSSNTYVGLRSYQFNNLTINAGVTFKPDGYPYYVAGNLAGSGTISTPGGNAGGINVQGTASWSAPRPLPNSAAGGLAGALAAGTSNLAIRFAVAGNSTGGALGANNGGSAGTLQGGAGGGGAGGAGGNGGIVTLAVATLGDWEPIENAGIGYYSGSAGGTARGPFTVGSGGGGGGLNGANTVGGGGSGGYQVGYVFAFTGTVVISSTGGNGSNGIVSGGGFAGGGGGGGSGGIVVLFIGKSTTAPTPVVTGGSGGTPSAGAGGAGSGSAGGSGKFIIFQ